MGLLSERLVFNTDVRFLQGFGAGGASALDAKIGAAAVLPFHQTQPLAFQLGAFAAGGFAVERAAEPAPYVGGGVSLSIGMARPSSFGVTLSGEVLTRGVRVSAMTNIPIPMIQAYLAGVSPHVSVGYVYEHKTDFRSGTPGETIHGLALSAGFDISSIVFGLR